MKMTFKTVLMAIMAISAAVFAGTKVADAAGGGDSKYKKELHWHFDGFFGTYDRAAMQRGYQVYQEVCASCHQLKYMSFRHLGDKGGPFYDKKYPNPIDNPVVKYIAANYPIQINDIDIDDGSLIQRDAKPVDKFPAPYLNDIAAASNNFGKAPPDLSVMAKARADGANHIYSFLLAYDKDNKRFNKLIGSEIAMPDQLYDGRVEYEVIKITDDEGNVKEIQPPEATREQMAEDVTEFLMWAADPKMEARKSLGLSVMIYLLILGLLMFFAYKEVWRNVKH